MVAGRRLQALGRDPVQEAFDGAVVEPVRWGGRGEVEVDGSCSRCLQTSSMAAEPDRECHPPPLCCASA